MLILVSVEKMCPTLWRQEVPFEGLFSLSASPTLPPSQLHGASRHRVRLPMELLPAVLRETAIAGPVVHPAAAQKKTRQ